VLDGLRELGWCRGVIEIPLAIKAKGESMPSNTGMGSNLPFHPSNYFRLGQLTIQPIQQHLRLRRAHNSSLAFDELVAGILDYLHNREVRSVTTRLRAAHVVILASG
jgi:hypothetical protein